MPRDPSPGGLIRSATEATMNDEAVRDRPRAAPSAPDAAAGRLAELGPEEALELLGSVRFGRIVFTEHALPAVRLVNHAVLDGEILIRTHAGAALTRSLPGASAPGVVVAYEADEIDVETRTGWSVVATGYARVLDRAAMSDSLARALEVRPPWFQAEMSHLVVIHPEIVTGRRLLVPAH
jgi:hypothetical protein